jgi:GNAT superfamily N-acetyltransferase
MQVSLIERCQQHLTEALQDRIQATRQALGNQFGFEIIQRGATITFLAHHWPQAQDKPAFHRTFNYLPTSDAPYDPLLERFVEEKLDVIVEVLPGAQAAQAEILLRTYHFQPVWAIPWFCMPLQEWHHTENPDFVQLMDTTHLAQVADVLIAGYGYESLEAAAWHAFATHGYSATRFSRFLAWRDQQPAAAGILHLSQDSALVDGAATLPAYRNHGLQKALLAARLSFAKDHGAVYAFSRTGQGSISQKNLEAIGMRLLTQSTAWRRLGVS